MGCMLYTFQVCWGMRFSVISLLDTDMHYRQISYPSGCKFLDPSRIQQ